MKNRYIISFLILVSTGIFISGLYWGLPSSKLNELYFTKAKNLQKITTEINNPEVPRSFYNPIRSYHPDEYFIIKTLQSIKLPFLRFSLEQISIGGVYLYLYGLILLILNFTGLVHFSRDITYYFLNPGEMAKFYITGRLLCCIYGLGIVLLTYKIAKRISKNTISPFWSAVLLILSPLFFMNAHYMYVDIPGLFWIMLTLYFAVRYLNGEKTSPVFMGLSSGMAAGTKLTFLLAFLIPLVTFLLDDKKLKSKIKNICWAFLFFIGIVIITYPYLIFSIHYLFWGKGQHATRMIFSPDFYLASLRYGMGTQLLLFIVLGFIFTLFKKHNKSKTVIVLWTILFFVIMSSLSLKFSRYIIPILPSLIIIGNDFWFSIFSKKRFIGLAAKIIFVVVVISTFVYGMAFELLCVKENIRTEAGVWIKENIPEGSSIGVTEIPWQFQMPPFDYYVYRVDITGYNITELKEQQPEYFILSSFQAPIPPYPIGLQEERIEFYKAFIESGLYTEEKRFEKHPVFARIDFKVEQLPEDLIYLNPTILVFKKAASGVKQLKAL